MNVAITHDGILDIAVGKYRKDTAWKNKEILWSDLVDRLSETVVTSETHREYLSLPKSKQDEIKDVGGFVGALLSGPRRTSRNIVHRQLITLDIDFAKSAEALWDDFTFMYGCAAVLHSSHKHSEKTPRLRLVIPASRPMFREEYEACARRVAGDLGIEMFDPTTFQVERFMYWPSTPKDIDYVFEYQDGKWLDVDQVLSRYTDWTNSWEWPVTESQTDIVRKSIDKQGDPEEKPGLVGAFCRVYDIHRAIEKFLPHVYERTDQEDRYTYKEGSTSGGLVVYDDGKFSFSHHGTDPTSGILCNAFDLVRIHLFKDKDEHVKPTTPTNKRPSFESMIDLARQDSEVKKLYNTERVKSALSDFDGIGDLEGVVDTESDPDWVEKLEVDKRGNILNTINNVLIILRNDVNLKGKFHCDAFSHVDFFSADVPWRKVTDETKAITNADDASIRHYLESVYGITNSAKIKDALLIHQNDSSFHPIRDYIGSLSWDGIPRVEEIFIKCMGVVDNKYTRAVTRKFMTAAVARVFKPGIKFDYMLILVGAQGLLKSTMLDKLSRGWFSDSFTSAKGKEGMENLQGVWIVEMSELAAMGSVDEKFMKGFITRRKDRFRVPYAVRPQDYPRQCVFVGTTNEDSFLRDVTGDRRYWPLECGVYPRTMDPRDLTDEYIDQLWAEAKHFYDKGELLYLNPELENMAKDAQEKHYVSDDLQGVLENYLRMEIPENWYSLSLMDRRDYLMDPETDRPETTIRREYISALEVHYELFGGTSRDATRVNLGRIHDILKKVKWLKYEGDRRYLPIVGRQRVYKIEWENAITET